MDHGNRETDLLLTRFGVDEKRHEELSAIWRVISGSVGSLLDSFYRKVAGDPQMALFFTDKAHMDHARAKQAEHWKLLFTDGFSDRYRASATRVGRAHLAIGLPFTLFMAMYHEAAQALYSQAMARRGLSRVSAAQGWTVQSAVMLDVALVMQAYFDADAEETAEAIGQLGYAVDALGKGRIKTRIGGAYPDRFAGNRANFNAMADRFEQVFDSVRGNAFQVETRSSDLTRIAEDLSSRAQNQAAAVEQSTAAMTELATSVRQNEEIFSRTVAASGSNSDAAERGVQSANSATDAATPRRAKRNSNICFPRSTRF